MTREAAKREIDNIDFYLQHYTDDYSERSHDAMMMAIKALSQEPCEDAISRKAVLEKLNKWDWQELYLPIHFKEHIIDELPSVTQKSGKWISVSEPPKELGTYLIQTDGEPYMCQCRWTDVNPFWTDLKTKPHWNIFDIPQYSKVVAWMPLPKPYEPQESEDKEKEMPWYLSIFNTELLKQKGHWITDDAWSDIAYNTEFLEFLYNHINPNDMEHYRQMFEMKNAVAVNGAEKESSDERDSD